MDNLSPSGATLFGTLIAANQPHFRHHFGPPPEARIFTQNLANHQPRLAQEKGAILATRGFPMGKSRAIYRRLGFPISNHYRG